MPAKGATSELSFFLKSARTADVPLEVYDALYYSGRFDPIFRVQGDMVLNAYYRPPGYRESRIVRAGRRLLKELTVDVKEKHGGEEVRIENLMPVFEEERAFYRDPRIRLSCSTHIRFPLRHEEIRRQEEVLQATEDVLTAIEGVTPHEEGRIVIKLQNGSFNTERAAALYREQVDGLVRFSATKHTLTADFRRELFGSSVIGFLEKTVGECLSNDRRA
ncbi:MAG: hypothetical protein KIY12_06105 [Thermoplasmata archaeon]|uniref:Uncharacterized protein n=1 Tax=Candidatus Sysuiplasma superficiale TaxID=2823368 RepID=A0A8J7YIN5_9ARCH|nr:hypothetical protein [Candidatus Sysuiplasma superficiale]MBX8644279.1 hypothetical protein [Candidatus Sysuiplasma superficiale]MCL4347112.1 hypothetical protein [Candidatus Thermoplasmatota archaeon]